MKHLIFLLIFSIFFFGRLNATQYFVDSDNGCDDSLGTSEILAWKTITKVNSGPTGGYYANDIISFKCGQRFPGTLIPPNSNLTFNSYNSGEKPVIDRNTWSGIDSIKYAVYSLNIDTGKNYLYFNNLKFINGWQGNINILGVHDITFESCIIDSAHQNAYASNAPGNIFIGCDSTIAPYNITIRNTTIQNADHGHGGYFEAIQNFLFEHNTVQNNGVNGIQLLSYDQFDVVYACYYDTIRYNTFKNNDLDNRWDYTIFDNGMRNSAVYYNTFEANTTGGNNGAIVRINNNYNIPPRQVGWYNNTFILHTGGEAFDWGPANTSGIDSVWVKNNIIYLDNAAQTGMWFYAQTGSYNVITNNLYHYPSGGGNLFYLGLPNVGTPYPSIQAWNTASNNFTTPTGGYEINSVTDPDTSTFIGTDLTDLQLKDGSNANLSGINVNLIQDFVGKKVGNPPDIGAYQKSIYIGGNSFLIGHDTLKGSVAIIDDFTVMPHWGDLTISPGTHIKIENGANLHVYGKLNCLYNDESSDIIIDTILSNNQIGSIIFDGALASGSVLKQVTLKHGTGIQCLNGANVDIEHSTLDTGSNGIYIYNSAPRIFANKIINPAGNGIYGQAFLQRPSIERNTISKLNNPQNASGIYLTNGSRPTITSNDVNGFDYGAYIGGGSTAYFFNFIDYFHYITPAINNRFTNNNIGICADSTSTIYAGGGPYTINGGGNGIYNNNNWNAEALANSHIYADNNYWGGGSQNNYKDTLSKIVISDTLSYNPWEDSESKKNNPGGNAVNQLKKLTDEISAGLLLEQNGQVDEAISFYKDLISRDRHVQFSLSELLNIYIMYSRNEILTYFNGFLSNNRYYFQVKKLLADFRIRNNEFTSGISAYNEIINNNPSTPEVINAKF
jgi:hypothetical protein